MERLEWKDCLQGERARVLEGRGGGGEESGGGGADNMVKVWDPITGEKRKNIEGWGKEVTSIGFVGDTDQIMASCGDGRVRITKSDGADVRAWAADADFVLGAAVSSDGSIVVSG